MDARPRHGYELSKLIHARSRGQLTFRIDSLYVVVLGEPLTIGRGVAAVLIVAGLILMKLSTTA